MTGKRRPAGESPDVIEAMRRQRLQRTIAGCITNRANGCLHVAWCETVALEILDTIEKVYELKRKEEG